MTLKKIKIFLFGFFILGITSIPLISLAQMQIELQEQEINVEVSPNNPQPYENVTIRVSSYAVDLNKSIITWKEDSVTKSSGIGKTSYLFTAKGPEISTFIDINIKPIGSISSIDKRITLTPSELEIMWEAVDGYTPPFYKGKSLPIVGGFIKVIAIPSSKTITSGIGNISYTWKNDGTIIQDASGYNKNSYVFKNSILDDFNEIGVIASSVNGDYNAENRLKLSMSQPKLIFYKKSPTEGILYNKALESGSIMTEDEMTIVAEPYFFTAGVEGSGDFSYDWKINNKSIPTPFKKTELTVRPSARGGVATVSLMIENLDELFQKVNGQIKINL